jgi:hypothetical protein
MDIAFLMLTAVLTALSVGLIALCNSLQGEKS